MSRHAGLVAVQLSLLDVPTPRRHRRVRETSRAQYAVAREQFEGRSGNVLRDLAYHWNATQRSPTSAELCEWAYHVDISRRACGVWDDKTFRVLYTRRGLSDLQTKGLVEAAGKRKCAVTGHLCMTWRVVSR